MLYDLLINLVSLGILYVRLCTLLEVLSLFSFVFYFSFFYACAYDVCMYVGIFETFFYVLVWFYFAFPLSHFSYPLMY